MQKNKIIFLDIDGVLNVIPPDYDQFGGIFHDHLVDNLNLIIKETGAKIVISSTWRFGGLERMKQMWQFRNLPGEVIDITPDCHDLINTASWSRYHPSESKKIDRGHEIDYWLDGRTDIESYVIIDDDNDFLPHQRGNFVRTANNINHPDSIDIGYGLTKECARRAITILNK
jgi:hypothetical protein